MAAESIFSGLPMVELSLFAFILATALATAALKDVLSSIIVFGSFSLGMAMYYILLLAPDVGMTEAAVSAGVTTVLLLLTIAKTKRPLSDRLTENINFKALIVVFAFVGMMGMTLQWFPAVGDMNAAAWNNPVTQYYLEHTYHDTHAKNTVAAVLAGYRGFDTFGEAFVVFTAGIASLIVLQREVFNSE